jgi:hypothetical protein
MERPRRTAIAGVARSLANLAGSKAILEWARQATGDPGAVENIAQ